MSDDIIQRLRARADAWQRGDLSDMSPAVVHEAADEIECLREALEPFAQGADDWEGYEDGYAIDRYMSGDQTVGDLRRARAALADPADADMVGEDAMSVLNSRDLFREAAAYLSMLVQRVIYRHGKGLPLDNLGGELEPAALAPPLPSENE